MASPQVTTANNGSEGFDLFRLSKSKATVDVCANTIRSYIEDGLPCYKRGKAVFISKTDLRAFLTAPVRKGRTAA
jgi:hypothetical protein